MSNSEIGIVLTEKFEENFQIDLTRIKAGAENTLLIARFLTSTELDGKFYHT